MTACHPRPSRLAVVVTAFPASCALHSRAPCPNGPCTVKTRCEGSNKVGSWRAQAPGSCVSCRSNPICPIHQPIGRGATRRQREGLYGTADGHLRPPACHRLPDSLRHHFRLIDRARWSGRPVHMAEGVAEIGCVGGWRKNGADPNGTAFQPQLASDRLSEGTHGRLCAGVGRHQRQAVEGHAEHTFTIAPRPRLRICESATRVPLTVP